MKNFIALISLLFAMTIATFAQSTSPRFGVGANQDNTGRVLTYFYTAISDQTGNDSINVNPHGWTAFYYLTMKDSFTFANPVITRSDFGDNFEIIANGASGTKIKFVNYATANIIANGTVTLSTKGKAIIKFQFDGYKWIETGRQIF